MFQRYHRSIKSQKISKNKANAPRSNPFVSFVTFCSKNQNNFLTTDFTDGHGFMNGIQKIQTQKKISIIRVHPCHACHPWFLFYFLM